MTYDAENKRVRKWQGGNPITYLYDIFGNVITIYGTASDIEQNYVWANGEPRAKVVPLDDPAADLYYYFHTDHLGTPYVLTNSSKVVDWKISTDPFGETVTEQNGDDNNFRFPGQYADRESGLDYNWHRYY
ncbi:MAG: RHS domain-containing protein, partial [candidate division Zixibacteria bacterium]|nr:RHS domain-containing protein [candidate division Zixibacteria bacterium]